MALPLIAGLELGSLLAFAAAWLLAAPLALAAAVISHKLAIGHWLVARSLGLAAQPHVGAWQGM